MTYSPTAAGRDLTAALIVSLAAVSFYASAASLMFQGALAPHLPVAIGAALLGAAILAVFGAFRGSLPLASMGPVPTTVPVLAAITAGIVGQTADSAALPTAVAAMVLTGLAIGVSWWVMGRYRVGDLIRYIPYPVVGGFLGSVGWLMFTGGMGVAIGRNFSLSEAWGWVSGQADARLACGIALGLLIWWVTQHLKHVLTLPGMVVLGGLVIHAGLWLAGMDLAAARAQGWLLAPFSQTVPAWPWSPDLLGAVDWGVVAQQAGLMVSAVILATISLLLSDTSLEVAWDERADINRDLLALGQGNLLAAVAGGLTGGVSISRSLLNRQAGAASRASGLAKGGICLMAMAWGGPVIALVPRPLLGGLLVYMGLGMLKEWIIDSRHRLPKIDYLTVLAMVAVTAAVDFLPAVCVGVLIGCLSFAASSARQSPMRRLFARSAWPGKVERSAAHAEFLQSAANRMRIVELQGVLFFGSATKLMLSVEALLAEPTPPERLLFDFQRVYWVDSSAGQALARFLKLAQRQGVRIDISQPSESVRRALEASGCLGADGPMVYSDIDAAVCDWDEKKLAQAGVSERTFEAGLVEALPSGTSVEQVMSYFDSMTLAPGGVLFSQGEASDALYLVRSGRLSVFVQVEGRELPVRAILAGGSIGEMGLFRSTPRSATIRADQASEVLRLHRSKLEAMESQNPELAVALYRLFLRQLAGRIDQLTAQASSLSR